MAVAKAVRSRSFAESTRPIIGSGAGTRRLFLAIFNLASVRARRRLGIQRGEIIDGPLLDGGDELDVYAGQRHVGILGHQWILFLENALGSQGIVAVVLHEPFAHGEEGFDPEAFGEPNELADVHIDEALCLVPDPVDERPQCRKTPYEFVVGPYTGGPICLAPRQRGIVRRVDDELSLVRGVGVATRQNNAFVAAQNLEVMGKQPDGHGTVGEDCGNGEAGAVDGKCRVLVDDTHFAHVDREALVRQLRGELIARIDEEKATIVGPILKSREEIIGMVLRDKGLVAFMEETAVKENKGKRDFHAVRKEARKYLDEIASDYNEIFIEIWEKILTWLWNNIYDGLVVDVEGIAKIRQVSKKMPFVIIPCHRSHIDYLLLSYIFFKNNIQMPFVAAGTNLAFFPMGYIFRKSGAFFLRRSFKGNELYGEVFARYIKVLLQEGLPLEFFIEGGRSRTGKMVMPKYGLLAMILQAYQEKACDDLAAIPVYIGYDRVIEEKSYLEELGGVPKEKEKTTDMIRSGKLLRKRYGRVYLNVGEPILLKSYLAAQEKPLEEMTVAERQSLYRRIGYTIVRAINKVSVVTPFALTASGLLCYDRRGISLGELRDVLSLFFDYLSICKVSFAMTFADRHKAVTEALNLFDQSGLISRMGAEDEEEEVEEVVYSLEDEKRMNLEYYKNNILHFFLPVSFVATSILATPEDMLPLNRIRDDYAFFKRLFRHEFIFDDQKDDLEEVRETLSYLRDKGMIAGFDREEKPWIEVKGRGRTDLLPFGGLIHNYMESYWVVIRGCYYLRKGAKAERDWLKYIRGLGARMYRKGEIRRAEALSQSNYQSAIRYLEDVNIISVTEVSEKGEKRFTKRYALTENKVQMESLRRRLFKFL